MQPIVLDANMPDTFYRGAGRIGRLRGVACSDKPEDWVASTTPRFGTDGFGTDGFGTDGFGTDGFGTDGFGTDGFGTDGFGTDGFGTDGFGTDGFGTDGFGTDGFGTDGFGTDGFGTDGFGTDGFGTDGMTRLADGSLLADIIAADPAGWLGREHVARYGPDTALLVKLLDAGLRLPVHVHPDRAFAAKHLASPYGKTEAWVVIEAAPDAAVYLGFGRDVPAAELAGWVRDQDVESMLGATNRVPVSAGDSIVCPAGTPHAIGEGILVVELQEPTDFSLLLERRGFDVGPDEGTLGLPMDEALGCVNRQALSASRLDSLRGRPLNQAAGSLLPAEADPFFVAERVYRGALPASYSVLIVTSGSGVLATESGSSVPLRRGSTVVIPYAAGRCALDGDLQAVRCLPAAA